jgi:hypothetical protein
MGPEAPMADYTEQAVDIPALLSWHGNHCSKCGHLLAQQSIDFGRCMNANCRTMLVAVTSENVLELHQEALEALGPDYWVSPLLTPETRYPGLRWAPSGLKRLAEVRASLAAAVDSRPDDEMRARAAAIEDELCQKLKYLSEYGGADWEVALLADWAPLSFSVFWYRKVGGAWKLQFNGGLQCDAVEQPFGSVVLGEPSYWSIHT